MLSRATLRRCLQHLAAYSLTSTSLLSSLFYQTPQKACGLLGQTVVIRSAPVITAAAATASFSTTRILQKAVPPKPKPPTDDEITEVFVKGSGPGGQKINKTSSAVQLKHIPTGIVVKCQESRCRDNNRRIARRLLGIKIDNQLNGSESWEAQKQYRQAKRKAKAHRRAEEKHQKASEERKRTASRLQVDDDEVDHQIDQGKIDGNMENDKHTEPAKVPKRPQQRKASKIVLRRDW